MAKIPTMRELEMAGPDAGELLDDVEREIKIAIAKSNDDGNAKRLGEQLNQLRKRRDEFFGPVACLLNKPG